MTEEPWYNPIVVFVSGMSVPLGSSQRMRAEVQVPHEELVHFLDGFQELVADVVRGTARGATGAWPQAYVEAMQSFLSGGGVDYISGLRDTASQLADGAGEFAYQLDYTNLMIVLQVLAFLMEWAITLLMWEWNPIGAAVEQSLLLDLFKALFGSTLRKFMTHAAMTMVTNLTLMTALDGLARWILALKGERTAYGDQYRHSAVLSGAIQGAVGAGVPLLTGPLNKLISKGFTPAAVKSMQESIENALRHDSPTPAVSVKTAGADVAGEVIQDVKSVAGTEAKSAGGKLTDVPLTKDLSGLGGWFGPALAKLTVPMRVSMTHDVVPARAQQAFRVAAGSQFERAFATKLGAEAARQMGEKWANAFLARGAGGGRDLAGALNEALAPMDRLGTAHGPLRNALSEGVARAMPSVWKERPPHLAVDTLFSMAHQNLSEGIVNYIEQGKFTTSKETTFGAAGGEFIGRIKHPVLVGVHSTLKNTVHLEFKIRQLLTSSFHGPANTTTVPDNLQSPPPAYTGQSTPDETTLDSTDVPWITPPPTYTNPTTINTPFISTPDVAKPTANTPTASTPAGSASGTTPASTGTSTPLPTTSASTTTGTTPTGTSSFADARVRSSATASPGAATNTTSARPTTSPTGPAGAVHPNAISTTDSRPNGTQEPVNTGSPDTRPHQELEQEIRDWQLPDPVPDATTAGSDTDMPAPQNIRTAVHDVAAHLDDLAQRAELAEPTREQFHDDIDQASTNHDWHNAAGHLNAFHTHLTELSETAGIRQQGALVQKHQSQTNVPTAPDERDGDVSPRLRMEREGVTEFSNTEELWPAAYSHRISSGPVVPDELIAEIPNMHPSDRNQTLDNLEPAERRWLARNSGFISALHSRLNSKDFAALAARLLIHGDSRARRPASARAAAHEQLEHVLALTEGDTAIALLTAGVEITIIPADASVAVAHFPRSIDAQHLASVDPANHFLAHARGIQQDRFIAVGEENLLGLHTTIGSMPHQADGYSTLHHEMAHAIHHFVLTDAERRAVRASFVEKRLSGPLTQWPDGPSTIVNGREIGSYSSTDEYEYFAQAVTAYLGVNYGSDPNTGLERNNGADWVRRNESQLLPILTRVLGAEPELHIPPANPVTQTDREDSILTAYRTFDRMTTPQDSLLTSAESFAVMSPGERRTAVDTAGVEGRDALQNPAFTEELAYLLSQVEFDHFNEYLQGAVLTDDLLSGVTAFDSLTGEQRNLITAASSHLLRLQANMPRESYSELIGEPDSGFTGNLSMNRITEGIAGTDAIHFAPAYRTDYAHGSSASRYRSPMAPTPTWTWAPGHGRGIPMEAVTPGVNAAAALISAVNMRLVNVESDGDCLYNAFIIASDMRDQRGNLRTAAWLRQDLASRLRSVMHQPLQMWQQMGLLDVDQRVEMINEIATTGMWNTDHGDNFPYALATMYGVTIEYFSYFPNANPEDWLELGGPSQRTVSLVRFNPGPGFQHWAAALPLTTHAPPASSVGDLRNASPRPTRAPSLSDSTFRPPVTSQANSSPNNPFGLALPGSSSPVIPPRRTPEAHHSPMSIAYSPPGASPQPPQHAHAGSLNQYPSDALLAEMPPDARTMAKAAAEYVRTHNGPARITSARIYSLSDGTPLPGFLHAWVAGVRQGSIPVNPATSEFLARLGVITKDHARNVQVRQHPQPIPMPSDEILNSIPHAEERLIARAAASYVKYNFGAAGITTANYDALQTGEKMQHALSKNIVDIRSGRLAIHPTTYEYLRQLNVIQPHHEKVSQYTSNAPQRRDMASAYTQPQQGQIYEELLQKMPPDAHMMALAAREYVTQHRSAHGITWTNAKINTLQDGTRLPGFLNAWVRAIRDGKLAITPETLQFLKLLGVIENEHIASVQVRQNPEPIQMPSDELLNSIPEGDERQLAQVSARYVRRNFGPTGITTEKSETVMRGGKEYPLSKRINDLREGKYSIHSATYEYLKQLNVIQAQHLGSVKITQPRSHNRQQQQQPQPQHVPAPQPQVQLPPDSLLNAIIDADERAMVRAVAQYVRDHNGPGNISKDKTEIPISRGTRKLGSWVANTRNGLRSVSPEAVRYLRELNVINDEQMGKVKIAR